MQPGASGASNGFKLAFILNRVIGDEGLNL
jgi:hypothetical protein